MHAKLQISAGVEYDFEPNNTSGARYHLVATPSVKTAPESLPETRDLTNPKSQILIEQLELTKMLDGLRSRCIIFPL